jgi:hypothetical protein
MNTTDEILKYRRAGKSIEWIKTKFGFRSNGSVYQHLNKVKMRPVYLTAPEIVVLRRVLTEILAKPATSEFAAEALANIDLALKHVESKQ